jgi:hypothetical protein
MPAGEVVRWFLKAVERGQTNKVVLILGTRRDAIAPEVIDGGFASVGSADAAEVLLATGDVSPESATEALSSAEARGDLRIMQLLLGRFPRINCAGALRQALGSSNVPAARMLLGRGCSFVPDFYMHRPHPSDALGTVAALHVAVRLGKEDIVSALAASAEDEDDVLLAAKYAAALGSARALHLLLQAKFSGPGKRLPAYVLLPQGEEAAAVWTQYQLDSAWVDTRSDAME